MCEKKKDIDINLLYNTIYENKEISATAIIVAAGKGTRMQSDINKQYLKLKEKPVLARTIEAFENNSLVKDIILVLNKDERDYCNENIIKPNNYKKVSRIVDGGRERQESVYNGIECLQHGGEDVILVHDGARPLITDEIITDCILTAVQFGCSCVGVPVKDTIKKVHIDGLVIKTLPRCCLWSVQTPQAFKYEIIKSCHVKARNEGLVVTDDASLAEYYGHKVKMVMGSYKNIKLTTPEDIIIAESLLHLNCDI